LTDVALVWNRWTFEPDIIVPTLLVCVAYGHGVLRRGTNVDGLQIWRHISFVSGMAAIFLALESPLDGAADHLFWVHQIQHLMLRMLGPMLIALSMPQATLISGLPPPLRRSALAPFAGSGVMRRLFSILTNAWAATALFIAALYVWQYPPLHNAAILNDGIHYSMHLTMLAVGLLFWWRVFDMRPPPVGLGYGSRLMMLWIATLFQVGLGAYLTVKTELLYPAYDVAGRLFGINPLTDEATGGFIIWVPSAMMFLLAAILMIHRWGKDEDRVWAAHSAWSPSNSDALRYPTTGAALIELARPKNRKLAIGVAGFAFAVFAMTIFAGVLNHLNALEHNHGLFAHAAPPQTFLR
jgi:putative membrane protein